MQARRILLSLAIALLIATAAASLVPVPEDTGSTGADSAEEAPGDGDTADGEGAGSPNRPESGAGAGGEGPARGARTGPEAVTIRGGKPPRTIAVEPEAQVVVTVASPVAGEVELEGLGVLQPVGPGTPAVFDLFTDTAGSFDVVLSPVDGPERRLGTIVVR